ncbi:MAG: o-succinylbenzoate synthase, partial [Chloroflexi bacterium]
IERILMHHITMPLRSPFTTSFGREYDRECIIVEMKNGSHVGYGECVASELPGYSYETAGTAWHVLSKFLIPAVVGKDLEEPEMIQEWMKEVRGHPMAKAALDQAAWDFIAKRDGISFAEKLAKPYAEGPRERVKVGVSVGIQEDVYDLIDLLEEYQIEGYSRIKMKIKPGYDLEYIRKAREIYEDFPFMVDANSAYTLNDVDLFKKMDDLNLMMIEQPLGFEDIYDHSQLHPQIKTPLCLDESITSFNHARAAIGMNACDIINIKPGRVGGWTIARQIHDLCADAGIGLWVGGMLETGIGRAGQLALASLPGFTLPGDISATERYYEEDIATEFKLNIEDGTITVPKGPGLGVELDPDVLIRQTLQSDRFHMDDYVDIFADEFD